MIGIVTVTYNSAGVIEEFLRSLFGQSLTDFRLYVVDNASEDGTLKLVAQARQARIRTIQGHGNVGIAAGHNLGIRAALADGCDRVLLLNNDTAFGPDMLANLAVGATNLGADIAVPKIVHHDDPRRIWCAGGRLSRWRAFFAVHFGGGEEDRGQYDEAAEVEFAPACCMLVARSVFERIGAMDEKYFLYYDDADFCFRARRAHLKLYYVPAALVSHKVSSLTGGSGSKTTIRFCTRGRVYFIRKHTGAAAAACSLAMCQFLFFAKLVLGRDSLANYMLKQRSFVEGLRL